MLEKRRGRKVSEDFSTERQREGKRTYLLRSTPGRDPQLPSQKDEGSFMSSQTPSKGTEGRERKERSTVSLVSVRARREDEEQRTDLAKVEESFSPPSGSSVVEPEDRKRVSDQNENSGEVKETRRTSRGKRCSLRTFRERRDQIGDEREREIEIGKRGFTYQARPCRRTR